jgi:hypothetical protein
MPSGRVSPYNPHHGSDLLHTRAVVHAFLHRRTLSQASDEESVREENTILRRTPNFLEIPIPETPV